MKRVTAFAFCLLAAAPALAQRLTDAQIRQRIIQESIANHPSACPCPYSVERSGRVCGPRSHYSRPGGYAPICYARDISDDYVRRWREARRNPPPGPQVTPAW
jgi:hypothetical protein